MRKDHMMDETNVMPRRAHNPSFGAPVDGNTNAANRNNGSVGNTNTSPMNQWMRSESKSNGLSGRENKIHQPSSEAPKIRAETRIYLAGFMPNN